MGYKTNGGMIYSLADPAVALALHSSTRPAQRIATIEAVTNTTPTRTRRVALMLCMFAILREREE